MSNLESAAVERAARILRDGGLVAFPTETVYGLGANALDAVASARIFEAKQRPTFDPLIVHIPSQDEVEMVATGLSEPVRRLAEAFWPGPLTLILPKTPAVPSIVTSGLETVAVRVPSHPLAQQILRAAGVPVAAPSANRFGQLSPTTAQHVVESLGDAVDYVVDGGPTEWGVESTIVDVTGDVPALLRHGATTAEEIEGVVGELRDAVAVLDKPRAPGQLASHYAPRTLLKLIAEGDDVPDGAALLAFRQSRAHVPASVLSETGNLREAAATLFEKLHQLDNAGCKAIYAERVPDVGLGRAINDRLTRAASA